jgi:hypothetical protein
MFCVREFASRVVASALIATSVLTAGTLQATAEPVATGGLHFAPIPQLVLDRIDLTLSPTTVRASYRFANTGARDVVALATFPMPEVERSTPYVAVASGNAVDSINLLAATAFANGEPVQLSAQQRALALGLDVTALLTGAQIALLPQDPGLNRQLAALSPAVARDLEIRGIIHLEDGQRQPGWVLHSTAFWRQTFKAGAVTNLQMAYTAFSETEPATDAAVSAAIEQACLEPAAAAELKRRAKAGGAVPTITTVHYHHSSLTWPDSIGSLKLTIELPDHETKVTMCTGRLVSISPRTLEWTTTDVSGDRDFRIAFYR